MAVLAIDAWRMASAVVNSVGHISRSIQWWFTALWWRLLLGWVVALYCIARQVVPLLTITVEGDFLHHLLVMASSELASVVLCLCRRSLLHSLGLTHNFSISFSWSKSVLISYTAVSCSVMWCSHVGRDEVSRFLLVQFCFIWRQSGRELPCFVSQMKLYVGFLPPNYSASNKMGFFYSN